MVVGFCLIGLRDVMKMHYLIVSRVLFMF